MVENIDINDIAFEQEWIKEGFTIVKGPEKESKKENKKKLEEAKAAEEAERKKFVSFHMLNIIKSNRQFIIIRKML